MSKYILAIHAGHNASALIGTREKVLYAVQEERLNGEKNYWGFPEQSILRCLSYLKITPQDVERIVVGRKQIIARYHSRADVMKSYARQDTLVGKVRQRVIMPAVLGTLKEYGQKEMLSKITALGFDPSQVDFFDHHTSHATTAYYGLRKSFTEPYLVVTCDGSGDGLCATVRVMGGGKSELVATTHWNDSLGAIYSWATYRMGFVPLEHEYKLMGMAPYTSASYAREIRDIFYSFLDLDETGLRFQRKKIKRISDSSQDIFAKLAGKRFDSICGGLQMFTEELLTRWIQHAVVKTGVKKVLAAGGVFMNVKANKVISELPEVDYFEAFPSCGDETLTFGAYYQYVANQYGDTQVPTLEHFYTGDVIEDEDVLTTLKKFPYSYRKMNNVGQEIAALVAMGLPVARCNGGMEFGARALGNRSILADPGNQDVVRVINQMVKKRDFWMPFAPMMKAEKSDQYIKNPKSLDSPYMMMTFDTRDNFRDLIAAVHNADLTCRAQLLQIKQNPEMYSIIDQFETLTGKSVVLNTSFNLHGFPIARNASDAMFIFENSGLEYMQLGNYLVSKR
jgi:carbamoyltransferase